MLDSGDALHCYHLQQGVSHSFAHVIDVLLLPQLETPVGDCMRRSFIPYFAWVLIV